MSKRKAVIYVAGPFRATLPNGHQDAWGIQQNVMQAMALGLEIWKLGHVALVPHANTMFFQNAAGTADDVWLDGDLELIRRCDAVLFTPDFERSAGARAEEAFAKGLGVPCLYTMDAVREYLAAWMPPGLTSHFLVGG
jgi:nucleoside 2-deoxyribosyltransferase